MFILPITPSEHQEVHFSRIAVFNTSSDLHVLDVSDTDDIFEHTVLITQRQQSTT
jgi:hypothetical protein